MSHHLRWFFPVSAGLLLVALVIGHGGRINRSKPWVRGLTLFTIAIIGLVLTIVLKPPSNHNDAGNPPSRVPIGPQMDNSIFAPMRDS